MEDSNGPFIQSDLGIATLISFTAVLIFTLIDLVDRAPRPDNDREVRAIDGFNVDLTTPAGYTIGEEQVADALSLEYLGIFIFSAVVVVFLFIAIRGWCEERWSSQRDDTESSILSTKRAFYFVIIGAALYAGYAIFFLEFSPWISYYQYPYASRCDLLPYFKCRPWAYHYYDSTRTDLFHRIRFRPFILMISVQSLLFGGVATLYSHPLIPEQLSDASGEELRLYGDTWWRYGQAALTLGVAVAVGAIIPFIFNTTPFGQRGMIAGVGFLFAGLGTVLIYIGIKHRHIQEKIFDEKLLKEE